MLNISEAKCRQDKNKSFHTTHLNDMNFSYYDKPNQNYLLIQTNSPAGIRIKTTKRNEVKVHFGKDCFIKSFIFSVLTHIFRPKIEMNLMYTVKGYFVVFQHFEWNDAYRFVFERKEEFTRNIRVDMPIE